MASALAVSLASAQTASQDNSSGMKVEEDPPFQKNRFGLSYRMGFNISARFKNLGGYPSPPTNPANSGKTPNGADWNYDNGYNLDDSPGTPPGLTWYWGYIDPAQVQGGNLNLSRSSSSADGATGEKQNDPQPGFELTYSRFIGKVGKGRWGLEGAFNFMNLSISDNRTVFGNVTVQTDAYALNGVIPPAPPYFGTYEGPIPGGPNRPVISDTPIAQAPSILANGASITGERKIEADVYGFRVGPYLEFPISQKLEVSLSGGFALASVHSKFKFNENVQIASITTTVPGGPAQNTVTRSGAGSHSDVLLGGYGAGSFSYAFAKSWSATVGAQYQNVGLFSQQLAGKKAELDLRKSIFVTIGIGYSF
jgi:hypothetical protein